MPEGGMDQAPRGMGSASRWSWWVGVAMSGLAALFFAMDGVMKLLHLPVVVQATAELGWMEASIAPLAIVLLAATALYAFPPTSILGAVLLTGYLGGAVATHARIGSPLFSHVLFGAYLGGLAWGGLYLRDPRLRALFPWRR